MTTTSAIELDNEVELRAMVTMVRLSARFTLGFVASNQSQLLVAARRALADALGRDAVGLVGVEASPDLDLLGAIVEASQQAECGWWSSTGWMESSTRKACVRRPPLPA